MFDLVCANVIRSLVE